MFRFSVRPAELKDGAIIYKINTSLNNTSLSSEMNKEMLNEILLEPTNCVLTAIHSGHVAGYIFAQEITSLTEPRYIEIVNLAVNKYYLEKGAVFALLGALSKWSEQMTAYKIIYPIKTPNEEKYINFLISDDYIKDERHLVFTKYL